MYVVGRGAARLTSLALMGQFLPPPITARESCGLPPWATPLPIFLIKTDKTDKKEKQMSWVNKHNIDILEKMLPRLRSLPIEVSFDVSLTGSFDFIAYTQSESRTIRTSLRLPGEEPIMWTRAWDNDCKWWTYTCTLEGVKVRIYGVEEAPMCCHPIKEKRKRLVKVPVLTEMKEVEEDVITGWDCRNSKQEGEESNGNV